MLKLMVCAGRGKIVVLGLSKMNIAKLQEGMPIKFSLEPFGMRDADLLIFAGDTEEKMVDELVQNELIDSKAADTMLRAMREDRQG